MAGINITSQGDSSQACQHGDQNKPSRNSPWHTSKAKVRDFNICLSNPWSVCNKITSLNDFIIEQDLDIMGLTETWLTGSDRNNPIISALIPSSYNIKYNPRMPCGGGTAVIHRSNLNVKPTPDTHSMESFEVLDCSVNATQILRSCVVYRPPPRGNNYIVKQFFHDADAVAFLFLVTSFGFQQHVTQSTHGGGHTLDLVLSRSMDSLVLTTLAEDHGFPDHFPVFLNLSMSKSQLPKQSVTYHKVKAIDPSALSQVVTSSTLCSSAATEMSLADLTKLYSSELSSIIVSLAPLRTRTVTIRPESEWYNSSIREAKQRRRQAERPWRKSGLMVHRKIYIQCGNSTDPLPANKLPSDLTDMFSDFFVQKITRIRSSITCDNHNPLVEPPALGVETKLSHFQHITVDEVTKMIRSSVNNFELDSMPTCTSLVKQEVTAFAPVITSIINKSLESGSFPTSFKRAIVTPLLKKASLDPDIPKKYQPVSNLAYISKVIEKVVAAQIQTYLSDCSVCP
ncbi:uncharacterized protein LOC130053569 [Ostrea edulis]|uniref:uncharacterized protein LOC130053569 n=1 Tax=Ostrea edulis TaxID=37623 RepID=UPI0024AE9860|nr:uncharacterized protein LOC130053569 [Ostrea edulis]